MAHDLNGQRATLDLAELQQLAYVAFHYASQALEDEKRAQDHALLEFHHPNTPKELRMTKLHTAKCCAERVQKAAAAAQLALDNLYHVEQMLVRPCVMVKDKLTIAELVEREKLAEEIDGD